MSGGVSASDQRVGVGRVADDEHPDVVGGVRVERGALGPEDAAVGLEKVGPFHALGSRAGTDEKRDVGAVERPPWIIGDVDAVCSTGNAQSSSSIAVPSAAFMASGISSSCSRTGVRGPSS